MPSHSARIADLSKEKQALLSKLIKEKSVSVNQSIGKRAAFSPCPLSFAQERLWFLAQMEPENPFYNMAGAVQLQGNLNSPALAQALNEVVRRHEALRTSFQVIDSEVRQVIHDSAAITVDCIDLTALNELQQESIVKTLEVQEAHRVFDLRQTPLLRAALLKLDEQRYVLLMTLHHIVSDEWSLRQLINEVGTYYQTYKNGNPSSAPELPVQYADFAAWQRNRLQGELYDRQIAYWRQYLESAPKALALPADRPRPAVMSYRGANHEFELDHKTTAALIELSRQADTTLFAVMMAAFTVLLSRYSGQDDICVGYPTANRNHRDIENLIGFFVNTQVLRSDLSGNPVFTGLLNRVRKNTLDAQNNQDLPFERLVEELKLERELNRTPLFQAMLVYQNAPMNTLNVSELHFELADAEMNSAKFDLTLNVSKSENTLRCSFNYSSDLFDGSTIGRMAGHLQTLLAAIIRQPETGILELPMLSETERRQIMLESTNTHAGYSNRLCLHQLFERQAATTPDAIAVVFEDRILSYNDLNCKANRLAHYLLTLGISPDDRVAICVERGLEMIVGLLGILKAGGAYVPLDPGYPSERLAYMLTDSAPVALLTESALQGNLSELVPAGLPVLLLDSVPGTMSYPEHNPLPEALGLTDRHLAYIIYTSGSTGLPKGVMVEHAQVTRLFAATQDKFHFDGADVWTLFHSFAFDFSVWELWGALIYGGRLVLVTYETCRSPDAFYALLCREGVTVLNQTPSAFRQLIAAQALNPEPHALRCIVFGGEALDFHSLAPWVERNDLERTQLINMYGITEITVHATYRRILTADLNAQRGSIVGRPLPDLSLYILDAQMQPVLAGVSGEIYIGGDGVARGYFNRPELSAERFIDNPFSIEGAGNSRLYKTGDLGRRLPDGEIEYLGRNDFQVKIRGFRIELGEIEQQLVACNGVRDAVVIAREDSPGDKRLVAYLIAQDGVELSASELRAQLAAVLADYMLPSAFITLAAFPLTSNGKLDREALPVPDGAFAVSRAYEAPQGPVETAIAGIWQELLGIERVGRHDNFFELGGHSLMLVGLIEPLRRQGFTANMRMVFAAPTLAAMADAVSNASAGPVAVEAPPNLIPDHFAQSLSHSMTEEFRI